MGAGAVMVPSELVMGRLAFVGGTGAQGLGLALRFARAGEAVVIGSRDASRADEAARRIRTAVPGAVAEGLPNLDAITCCERVVLTLPAPALPGFLHIAAARAEVAALVAKLPGLRAVDAGRLANARYLEAITALLLNLNRKYRARTSIAIVGLD